ncbi:SDR family oxidoreductase [Mycolicibacterium flavescens]|uniref:Short-chain dehydrogenase n=1 Tax=Mycolicibacterium flavescens TaxID=1776 RepID=A0A1E3RHK0_MYCFV|nr:SDR family oxidoreductase [Mycolicibacterium flavescens]MCV7280262.1 SDR family oxidoreductase [Mycolicibacterium flavescens]ODQ89348.1 short-chain dehydrogenase [Mycolicibacterium flavescens]
MTRLQGRVAIVTGAGQGLGKAISAALADEGASVALLGRTKQKVDDVAAELAGKGRDVMAIGCDVADRAAVDKAVAETSARFGRIDILINNAQGGALGTTSTATVDLSDEEALEYFRTGPLGSLHLMQAAFPSLRESPHAVVINFGSAVGVRGAPRMAGYSMAKEALGGLTKSTAIEWGKYGIRVNLVCPAAWSPAAETFRDENPARFEQIVRGIPLRRYGDPYDDIGRAIVGLVSDDLRFLTGATLMLDGGQIILR